MRHLKQAAVEGNNIEAVKAKRVVVNLFEDNSINLTVYGKYYFNEYPELNHKTIVGIKFNSNVGQSQNLHNDFAIDNGLYLDNNIGIGAYYADTQDGQGLLLNLFNEKNELIIQNMPLNSLNPELATYQSKLNGKILPFDTKLNLKASYILSTFPVAALDKKSVSLTFYYLDK